MTHKVKTSAAQAGIQKAAKPKSVKPKAYGFLLALAAFSAALYYALMLPHMVENRQVSPEDADKAAMQIIGTAQQVESDILHMVAAGTAAADILTHDEFNLLCRKGRDCLFAREGGGAAIPLRPRSAKGRHLTIPHWRYRYGIGTIGWRFEAGELAGGGVGGFDRAENLWVIALEDLPPEICTALNERLEISGIPVEDDSAAPEGFENRTGRISALPAKKSGCIDWRVPHPDRILWDRAPFYVFYHVMEMPG